MNQTIVVVSGYFDPLHVGHLRMFEAAKKLGGILVVIVNNDEQTINKKGYFFMPCEDRREIIGALRCVTCSLTSIDVDKTVSLTLSSIAKSFKGFNLIFANGGDRTSKNVPEVKICEKLGIMMAWGVGGKKLRSSSEMVKKAEETKK